MVSLEFRLKAVEEIGGFCDIKTIELVKGVN